LKIENSLKMINENLIGFEKLPQTIPHFCLESFRRNSKPDALSYKIQDAWQHFSGAETIEKIKRIALGLSIWASRLATASSYFRKSPGMVADRSGDFVFARRQRADLHDAGGRTNSLYSGRFRRENAFVSGKKLWKHAENAIQSVERLEKLIFFDADAVPKNDNRAMTGRS
jgi:hypothetical protein